jgi:hypothetical protein
MTLQRRINSRHIAAIMLLDFSTEIINRKHPEGREIFREKAVQHLHCTRGFGTGNTHCEERERGSHIIVESTRGLIIIANTIKRN